MRAAFVTSRFPTLLRTIMHALSLRGSYLHHEILILVDSQQSSSAISLHFAQSHNIPLKTTQHLGNVHATASAPFSVPTHTGWFRCVSELPVRMIHSYDLVLGLDWIEKCGVEVDSEGILDPTAMERLVLPRSITWLESSSFCGAFLLF